MNELIKYFEALEARLAAQEERIAKLESVVNKFIELQPQLEENMKACSDLAERMNKILDEGIQVTAEPEVDVELIYPEDEEATVELPQEDAAVVEPVAEPVAEPEPEVALQPEPKPVVEPQPVVEPEPQPAPAPEPAPVSQPEASRAPQQTSLFGAAVTDIRQAVSIGDRFLFQRELFGGNAEKLQQTLTELNALHSFDEAVAFIERFGWDKQSPTHELFINVLRRRFQ
jgi:outer membrane biosynthesis protein TonB